MGLEVMNSTDTELKWKIVKGRRSRKSTSRSPTGNSKVSNSTSPKRVGDFSGSDSDKFGEAVPGQSTSPNSENVPIKKRRHLLQTSSSTHSLCGQDSTSPGTPSSSPFVKDHERLPDQNCSSLQRSTNWEQRGIEGEKFRFEEGLDNKCNDEGDFSGIELLAAAASMDDHTSNANGEDLVVGDSSATSSSGAPACVTKSELPLKSTELENFQSDIIVSGGNGSCSMDLENSTTVSCSPHGILTDEIIPKVDRQHWDLNTLMDSWDKPYEDDAITGSILKDVNYGFPIKERKKYNSSDESKKLKVAETLGENSTEPTNSSYSNDASSEAAQVLNFDVPMFALNENTNKDAIPDHSTFTELCQPSDMSMPVDSNTISLPAILTVDGDCSINLNESKRATNSDDLQRVPHDVISHNRPTSEAAADIQLSDIKDSSRSSGPHEPDEHDSRHEDNDLSSKGSEKITLENLCKSSSAGVHCDKPTSSIGNIGSAIGASHDSYVAQDSHIRAVDGDVNEIQAAHGSPYEDGELISSFLYSWEDNECVDYESDGRNGDDSDAVKVENGSEGSYATKRRSVIGSKLLESDGSRDEARKHSLRHRAANDKFRYNVMVVKESNTGSGTTNEHPIERRQKYYTRGEAAVNTTQMDEYASNISRFKFRSRIEGRTSLDATSGKDMFYTQQCRSRGGRSSYNRPERNISADRRPNRYRPSGHYERDEEQNWVSWDSRRRHAEEFSCTRPTSITRESVKVGGPDFHEPRESASYLPKGMDGRVMRSPTRRDDYFGMRRRMPLKRGVSNYRGRGHYSQYAGGRDLGEDFEPFTDDTCPPVRFPRHLSRKDPNFSPTSGRSTHMSLPRRRSRSRSRTNSPRAWHQERILSTRRHSRSPDIRPDERMRMVFPRSSFAADCEDYQSPPRRRIPPSQQNCGWDGDHAFPNNDSRHRRSPVRVFRRTQPLDSVGSSGRLKSDGYFRPNVRPGKFTFNGGRECYDDGSTGLMHRRVHPDSGSVRRFRHKVVNDFETSTLNDGGGVDVWGTDPSNVSQRQGEDEGRNT